MNAHKTYYFCCLQWLNGNVCLCVCVFSQWTQGVKINGEPLTDAMNERVDSLCSCFRQRSHKSSTAQKNQFNTSHLPNTDSLAPASVWIEFALRRREAQTRPSAEPHLVCWSCFQRRRWTVWSSYIQFRPVNGSKQRSERGVSKWPEQQNENNVLTV